jgi:hypothetical protein
VQVGPVTGDPEKDSVGFVPPRPGDCDAPRPRFADTPRQVGPSTGDAEKDTVAFEVIGQDNCERSAARWAAWMPPDIAGLGDLRRLAEFLLRYGYLAVLAVPGPNMLAVAGVAALRGPSGAAASALASRWAPGGCQHAVEALRPGTPSLTSSRPRTWVGISLRVGWSPLSQETCTMPLVFRSAIWTLRLPDVASFVGRDTAMAEASTPIAPCLAAEIEATRERT